MSHFMMGVSNDLLDVCREVMLHDNMDIFRLVVHNQQVEEIFVRKNNGEAKKLRQDLLKVVLLRVGLMF